MKIRFDFLQRTTGGLWHELPDHEDLRHQDRGEDEEGHRRSDRVAQAGRELPDNRIGGPHRQDRDRHGMRTDIGGENFRGEDELDRPEREGEEGDEGTHQHDQHGVGAAIETRTNRFSAISSEKSSQRTKTRGHLIRVLSPDGIQIHIRHARQHRTFIQQALAFEAPCPKKTEGVRNELSRAADLHRDRDANPEGRIVKARINRFDDLDKLGARHNHPTWRVRLRTPRMGHRRIHASFVSKLLIGIRVEPQKSPGEPGR